MTNDHLTGAAGWPISITGSSADTLNSMTPGARLCPLASFKKKWA